MKDGIRSVIQKSFNKLIEKDQSDSKSTEYNLAYDVKRIASISKIDTVNTSISRVYEYYSGYNYKMNYEIRL